MNPERASRESERRLVSVLFADISGFTAMSEKMDPEEVSSIINRCFQALERIVQSHGGYVDKYIGDCIMALFGAPKALEDAPKRAVNAAIEIRTRIGELDADPQCLIPLGVHIGINSGLVIAGEVGGPTKRDFTVVGDTVNVASRLKDESPNGSIYVGAETHRYTRDAFKYKSLPPLTVKGKEAPLAAFELLSVREQIHRPKPVHADRMITSEIVGRGGEMQEFTQAICRVVAGNGGIVNLVGEAGIGKSRLITEVMALEQLKHATVLEGRSLSIGQSLSFHPFVDLLRHWAGITEDDDSECGAVTKLEAAVRELFASEADEIFPFVATLMGMRVTGVHAKRIKGIEGEALEKVTLKSMRNLFRKMAEAHPLVLVFEDLHWADLSSMNLLEPLLRLAESHPVLFINIFRPQPDETSERILRLCRDDYPDHHVSINLERLTDKECDLLIQNLLKATDLPYTTRSLIWQKAEGNPFFIEEVIRSLIDDGAVEFADGRFRVTEKIHTVVIPATINDVIMARVDRLDESTRQVLQVASVVGRSFYYRTIADLMHNHENLDEELGVLKEKQLIFERRTRRTAAVRRRMLAEELEYVFKHALAHETIYNSILHKTRKELHLRVAQSTEASFQDRLPDFYGMLAYHFSKAENLDKAEEYLFKAGDEAARSAASSEALTYFQEASRLYFLIHSTGGDPARKALLEKNVGLALLNKGSLLDCIEHFDRSLEFLGEPVPKSKLPIGVRFALDLTALLYRLYAPTPRARLPKLRPTDQEVFEVRFNRARAQMTSDPQRYFFDTIGSLRRLNQTDATAIEEACGMFAGGAALFAFSGFSFDVGRRFLDIAQKLVRPGNARDMFVYRSMRFIHQYLEGNWGEEQAIPEDLVEQGLRYGQLWDVTTYLGFCCSIRAQQGDFETARKVIDRIAEINDEFAYYDFGNSHVYSQTAILLLEQRQLEKALDAIDVYYKSRHEQVMNLLALGMKAKTQILLGDRESAESTLAQAEQVVRRAGRVPPWHLSDYVVSRFLFDLGALEDCLARGDRSALGTLRRRASKSGKEAVRIATKVAKPRTEVFKLTGRLCWLLGEQEKALVCWTKSIEEGKKLGVRPDLARTYMEIAERISGSRSKHSELGGMDAQACLRSARDLLSAIGLAWDLERVGALERRAA